MKNVTFSAILFALILTSSNTSLAQTMFDSSATAANDGPAEAQVKVLNFGTFHMGFTSDANKAEFDQHDAENQQKVRDIAARLAAFDPTVIIVEQEPQDNEAVQKEYAEYVDNPGMQFDNPSEIELIAYEVGRLSGAKRIYGIDHKMGYNYRIGHEIQNAIDAEWYDKYYDDPKSFYPPVSMKRSSLSLLNQLKMMNHDRYLDFLIAVNADMLTHAGTEDGFEGADEAAKYYKRNLRMYSNLNRLDLDKDDRVFILMGASHTAFFRDFMSRDPKYHMTDTFRFLND